MMYRNKLDFLCGVVIGAVLGTVTTLFLAPQTGDELRHTVGDKAQQVKDSAFDYMDSVKDSTHDYMDSMKDSATDYMNMAKDKGTHMKDYVHGKKIDGIGEEDDTFSAHEEFEGTVEGAMNESSDIEPQIDALN